MQKSLLKQLSLLYVSILLMFFLIQFFVELAITHFLNDEFKQDRVQNVAGYYLALETLEPLLSKHEWQTLLQQMSEQSSFHVESRPLDAWKLPEQALIQIQAGNVWVESIEHFIVYKRLPSSEVVKVGPMRTTENVEPLVDYINFLYPVLLFALITLCWMIWLQFRIAGLEKVIAKFSNGDLTHRTPEGYFSLGTLSTSFNKMADCLQRLIQSHKQLTNAVSHELRSPIGRIRFQLEMLSKLTVKSTPNDRYIVGISDDLDEMETLIEELLTYAKMERTEPLVTLETVDITRWLLDSKNRLDLDTRSAINLTVSNDRLYVSLDQLLMYRLLRNLVCNADRAARTRIEIGFEQSNGYNRLWVDDDGDGIPEDQRTLIFEPFARVDTSRNRDSGGFGLGLAIAAQITRCHHGTTSVHSSPYGGARLLVEWPVTPAA